MEWQVEGSGGVEDADGTFEVMAGGLVGELETLPVGRAHPLRICQLEENPIYLVFRAARNAALVGWWVHTVVHGFRVVFDQDAATRRK